MVTLRRVQQLFAAKPDIVWSLMPTVPKLTPHHRHQRLKWGREMAVKGESWWRRVVFSDESRFPLDGPDGLSAHWHDTRRPWRWHHNRQNQGGSVMIWTCFSAHDKSELVFINGNMDSSLNCATLGTTVLPFIEQKHPRGAIFQQDNAPEPHICLH